MIMLHQKVMIFYQKSDDATPKSGKRITPFNSTDKFLLDPNTRKAYLHECYYNR
jgi:hypothetical protein